MTWQTDLRHEPIFNIPRSVVLLIAAFILIHAARTLLLSDDAAIEVLFDWAVIPLRWSLALGLTTPEQALENAKHFAPADNGLRLALTEFVLDSGGGRFWTGLSYALLHGSWAHILVNSLWLVAFGSPVARRCGTARFLILAAASAIGGAVAHVLLHPLQPLPLIGASASVSGMMAAAAWFMFSPLVFGRDGRPLEPHDRPRERIGGLVRNRPVVIFLVVWFGLNYLSAQLAGPLGMTDASIAWEAHIGGFVVGLLLFPLLDPLGTRARPAH
jgi:membrane associated rhomboid family serine protease